MNPPQKRLALVIDGDNAQLNYAKQIIEFCKVFGNLIIKKAYGDWKKPPLAAHRQAITNLGITCEQQDRIGKNATDHTIVADVAVMLEKGAADIYFIVSSDGDFTVLCERIRQKGANVIGIGSVSNTSSTLQKSCSLFYYDEEIVQNLSKSKPSAAKEAPKKQNTPSTKPAATAKPKTAPVPKILIQAYQKTPQEDGWVNLGHFGNVLRQLDSQFNEKYANKKLSTVLKGFPHKFEVDNNRVRMK